MRCWNSFIVRNVASRAGKARSSTGRVVSRDLEAICMACEKEVSKGHEKEVSKGHMHGYFSSEEELESHFGTGKWRAIRCLRYGRTVSVVRATIALRVVITRLFFGR